MYITRWTTGGSGREPTPNENIAVMDWGYNLVTWISKHLGTQLEAEYRPSSKYDPEKTCRIPTAIVTLRCPAARIKMTLLTFSCLEGDEPPKPDERKGEISREEFYCERLKYVAKYIRQAAQEKLDHLKDLDARTKKILSPAEEPA